MVANEMYNLKTIHVEFADPKKKLKTHIIGRTGFFINAGTVRPEM